MKKTAVLTAVAAGLFAATFISCAEMKASRPIIPLREYDKMLVGSLSADYVGNDTCLKACHDHDQIAAFLADSVHGQQKVEGTSMPLVNCETCHGPGSEAIEPEFLEEKKQCDTARFVKLTVMPASVQSHLCLKCHGSYSMTSMQFWTSSDHAIAEVGCPACHKLHQGSKQKQTGAQIIDLCLGCHTAVKSDLKLRSRHPIMEGGIVCVECHDPHGSQTRLGLKSLDEKGICVNCHGQFIGPFAFEHADLTDACTSCHRPHGSMFNSLLTYQEPFLCLQCHTGHTDVNDPADPLPPIKQAFYSRCTSCHSQIHGTDTRGPHPGSGLTQ